MSKRKAEGEGSMAARHVTVDGESLVEISVLENHPDGTTVRARVYLDDVELERAATGLATAAMEMKQWKRKH